MDKRPNIKRSLGVALIFVILIVPVIITTTGNKDYNKMKKHIDEIINNIDEIEDGIQNIINAEDDTRYTFYSSIEIIKLQSANEHMIESINIYNKLSAS